MKKFLSMVLALIMVLSMFTVGAGAVDFDDFADVDEIQYKAAVEMMTELGILSGYDNGYFTPNGTISRGAAAKILAYIALGEDKAEALTCVESPFSDVAITSSVAPYIAWVAKEGIAIGYDNGTFGSKAAVSGHAYLKMVLGAIGITGTFEGDGWRLNVTNAAAEAGLFAGIDTTAIDLRASATRELACQIAFNAMFYSKSGKTTEYIVYTNVGGEAAYEAAIDTLHYKGTSASEAAMIKLVNGSSVVTSNDVYADSKGSKNYDLSKTTGYGEFRRPSTVYTSGEYSVSVADAKTPVLTITNGAKVKDIWTKLGYTKTSDIMTLNVIGIDGVAPLSATTHTYFKGKDAADSALNTSVAGKGSIIEVYKTETAKTYDVIIINTYVETLVDGEVKAAVAATATADAIPAYIKVEGSSTDPEAATNFKTDAFKVGDVIVYTKDNGTIKTVAKATKIANATVDKYTLNAAGTSTTNVTVGGVTLNYSTNTVSGTKDIPANFITTYDFYLDTMGNIVKRTTAVEAVSKDYVYVIKYQVEQASSANLLTGATANQAVAQIVTIDGVKKTVDLKITKETIGSTTTYYYDKPVDHDTVTKTVVTSTVDGSSNPAAVTVGDWFAYVINEDGTYTLKAIDSAYADVVTNATLTKGNSASLAGKWTNSKTTVTAIDTKQVVTTGTGLVGVELTGKVLVTYAKATATTITAIYAAQQETAAVTSATEYVYALKKGAVTSKGTEWTFAVDGAKVTYVCDLTNSDTITAGNVYTLTVKDGVATAALVSGSASTAGDDRFMTNLTVKIVDEAYVRIAVAAGDQATYYLADDFIVTCVEGGTVAADTLTVGDVITLVVAKNVNGNTDALAAFITTAKK